MGELCGGDEVGELCGGDEVGELCGWVKWVSCVGGCFGCSGWVF